MDKNLAMVYNARPISWKPSFSIVCANSPGSSERASGNNAFVYRASKAAALNLGRNLAAHLAPNIAVGIYHPGWVQTDMGGTAADIDVSESAKGLAAQFDALSMDTTGKFLTWDGREHPF